MTLCDLAIRTGIAVGYLSEVTSDHALRDTLGMLAC